MVWVFFVLGIVGGVVGALLWGATLAARLAWPIWVAYLVVFVDIALVVYSPYQLFLYVQGLRAGMAGLIGSLLLTLVFVIAPIAGLVWLLS